MVLKINDIEYKLKFGYRAVATEGVLKKVGAMQTIVNSMGENEDNFSALAEILEILADVVAVGIGKDKLETMDLLEEYFNENIDNEEVSVLGLYGEIIKELTSNAFLQKMFPKELQEMLAPEETKEMKTAAKKKN